MTNSNNSKGRSGKDHPIRRAAFVFAVRQDFVAIIFARPRCGPFPVRCEPFQKHSSSFMPDAKNQKQGHFRGCHDVGTSGRAKTVLPGCSTAAHVRNTVQQPGGRQLPPVSRLDANRGRDLAALDDQSEAAGPADLEHHSGSRGAGFGGLLDKDQSRRSWTAADRTAGRSYANKEAGAGRLLPAPIRRKLPVRCPKFGRR